MTFGFRIIVDPFILPCRAYVERIRGEEANGATVWLLAFWFNARPQNGPACYPLSTNIPGGLLMAA
jgi:hypothetical protein